ncbi:hypothetical protein V4B14_003121 [Salmonella enterica]|nr:hypothetical protein [Salmonella enterica]EBR3613853.1 hypothetical protein [Salmonella enterica]EIL0574709.1 hypothetical protein [Salmonella enterica]HAF1842562.1 hypothetical protein [Salmonella enterica]
MTTITNNKLTDEQRWCPDVDPITRYPLFMWINHPELGYVPTYGGPYDSYTLTERDENGEFYRHRYDHDRGGWVEDEYVGLIVVEDWLPKDQVELNEYVQDNPTAELQERRKADNQEPASERERIRRENEPVAYLVCNGHLYQDRPFLDLSTARKSVKDRNDGAEIKALCVCEISAEK